MDTDPNSNAVAGEQESVEYHYEVESDFEDLVNQVRDTTGTFTQQPNIIRNETTGDLFQQDTTNGNADASATLEPNRGNGNGDNDNDNDNTLDFGTHEQQVREFKRLEQLQSNREGKGTFPSSGVNDSLRNQGNTAGSASSRANLSAFSNSVLPGGGRTTTYLDADEVAQLYYSGEEQKDDEYNALQKKFQQQLDNEDYEDDDEEGDNYQDMEYLNQTLEAAKHNQNIALGLPAFQISDRASFNEESAKGGVGAFNVMKPSTQLPQFQQQQTPAKGFQQLQKQQQQFTPSLNMSNLQLNSTAGRKTSGDGVGRGQSLQFQQPSSSSAKPFNQFLQKHGGQNTFATKPPFNYTQQQQLLNQSSSNALNPQKHLIFNESILEDSGEEDDQATTQHKGGKRAMITASGNRNPQSLNSSDPPPAQSQASQQTFGTRAQQLNQQWPSAQFVVGTPQQLNFLQVVNQDTRARHQAATSAVTATSTGQRFRQHQQQNMPVIVQSSISEIKKNVQSKMDLYRIFSREGQLHLPKQKDCRMDFLCQILTNKKQALHNSQVRIVDVPRFPEFSVFNVLKCALQTVAKDYLPNLDLEEVRIGKQHIDRRFLNNIVNTLFPRFFPDNIFSIMKKRDEKRKLKTQQYIECNQDLLNLIENSYNQIQSKRGRAAQYLKNPNFRSKRARPQNDNGRRRISQSRERQEEQQQQQSSIPIPIANFADEQRTLASGPNLISTNKKRKRPSSFQEENQFRFAEDGSYDRDRGQNMYKKRKLNVDGEGYGFSSGFTLEATQDQLIPPNSLSQNQILSQIQARNKQSESMQASGAFKSSLNNMPSLNISRLGSDTSDKKGGDELPGTGISN